MLYLFMALTFAINFNNFNGVFVTLLYVFILLLQYVLKTNCVLQVRVTVHH